MCLDYRKEKLQYYAQIDENSILSPTISLRKIEWVYENWGTCLFFDNCLYEKKKRLFCIEDDAK